MAGGEIFISVASYRDPQLMPTLRDCIAKARHPERLVFGICWQHDAGEDPGPLLDDPRFRVIAVPHQRARGTCWARSRIETLYDGEEYFLQIDSHHRFREGWDELLVGLWQGLREHGVERPLLTAYASPFREGPETEWAAQLMNLRFERFCTDEVVRFQAEAMGTGTQPVPARFFSGHFAFSSGSFCLEVPYDPGLYFKGEELSMAIRAFTHGYDLFHPHIPILWHQYGRNGARRHWDDHDPWAVMHRRSLSRLHSLLGVSRRPAVDLGIYGLGTRRGLVDYERYAGLRLASRRVSAAAISALPPRAWPPPEGEADEADLVEYCASVRPIAGPAEVPREVQQACVKAWAASGMEVLHRHLVGQEARDLAAAASGGTVLIFAHGHEEPTRWVTRFLGVEAVWGPAVLLEAHPVPAQLGFGRAAHAKSSRVRLRVDTVEASRSGGRRMGPC